MTCSCPGSRSQHAPELGVNLRTLDSLPGTPLPAEGRGVTGNAVGNERADGPRKTPAGSPRPPPPPPSQEALSGCSLADPRTWEDTTLTRLSLFCVAVWTG